MNSSPALSVVIPCYNEAQNIPLILDCFRTALAGRSDIEVLLVNNGSTDASKEIMAKELQRAANAFARTVTVRVNQGYGYGIMSGLREARGDVLAWTHADMQTDPADVLSAYSVFARQEPAACTFLKGKRVSRNPIDAFFTLGMSLICTFALRENLFDVNAQPKMFHRSFLMCMQDTPNDFSLDLYVLYLARKKGMNILEHPVHFANRQHGEAKGGGTLRGKARLIQRTWAYILELRKHLNEGVSQGSSPVRKS